MEAELIHKKAIDELAVVHDEACMNDANRTGGIRRRQAGMDFFRVSQVIGIGNRNLMPFVVFDNEADELSTVLLLDLAIVYFVEVEILFESIEVVRKQRNFGEKTRRRRNRHFFEVDSLAAREK